MVSRRLELLVWEASDSGPFPQLGYVRLFCPGGEKAATFPCRPGAHTLCVTRGLQQVNQPESLLLGLKRPRLLCATRPAGPPPPATGRDFRDTWRVGSWCCSGRCRQRSPRPRSAPRLPPFAFCAPSWLSSAGTKPLQRVRSDDVLKKPDGELRRCSAGVPEAPSTAASPLPSQLRPSRLVFSCADTPEPTALCPCSPSSHSDGSWENSPAELAAFAGQDFPAEESHRSPSSAQR